MFNQCQFHAGLELVSGKEVNIKGPRNLAIEQGVNSEQENGCSCLPLLGIKLSLGLANVCSCSIHSFFLVHSAIFQML
jgi:hypothetical protein